MDTEAFTIIEDGMERAKIKDDVEILVDHQFEEYDEAIANPTAFLEKSISQKEKIKLFEPPIFGVTVLGASHGFDPKGSTSGYIIWVNGRGIMLDPPPFSYFLLKKHGIPPSVI